MDGARGKGVSELRTSNPGNILEDNPLHFSGLITLLRRIRNLVD